MEFSITNTEVNGLDRSVVASGNSYRTFMRSVDDLEDKDWTRADKLGAVPAGSGHDSFLNGITVIMDVNAPLYWWKQAQRYHWLEFISSQSTMHCITKFKISDRCVVNTDSRIVAIVEEMVDKYNRDSEWSKQYKASGTQLPPEFIKKHEADWQKIIASLPCGFCLGATMVTNYRQIKTMCLQRKNHHLKEWKAFIEWAVSLPHFSELTGITAD